MALHPSGAFRRRANLAVCPRTCGWIYQFAPHPIEKPMNQFSSSLVTSVTYPLDRVGQVSFSARLLPAMPDMVFVCFAVSGRGANGADLSPPVTPVAALSELSGRGLLEWTEGETGSPLCLAQAWG